MQKIPRCKQSYYNNDNHIATLTLPGHECILCVRYMRKVSIVNNINKWLHTFRQQCWNPWREIFKATQDGFQHQYISIPYLFMAQKSHFKLYASKYLWASMIVSTQSMGGLKSTTLSIPVLAVEHKIGNCICWHCMILAGETFSLVLNACTSFRHGITQVGCCLTR